MKTPYKKTSKTLGFIINLMSLNLAFLSCCSLWPADPENTPESNFEVFWQEFNICYALFEEKRVNWDAVYNTYRPQITHRTTDKQLFNIFKEMTSLLNDSHVYISSPFDYFKSGKGYEREITFSLENVKNSYLTEVKKSVSQIYTYGLMSGNIGYIHIAKMQADVRLESHEKWVEEINPILAELSNTSGIIIDVRNNGGGLVLNSRYIASRFSSERRTYGYSVTKNGPARNDYSPKTELYFNGSETIYSNPVVLLTNNLTASAAEEFTLAMNTIPTVTHVGETTTGVFSISLGRQLPNGWRYTVSPQKVIDIHGNSPEGLGVSPKPENLILNTVAQREAGIDRQLEHAIHQLTNSL